jgi:hypothetical protein
VPATDHRTGEVTGVHIEASGVPVNESGTGP